MAAQNAPPQPGPSTLTVKGRDMRIRTLGFIVLAGLAIWFIAVNTGSVSIRLWIPTVTLPLWVVLTGTLLVGIALGLIISNRRRAARRRASR
ncbi:LapA family protein [Streptomyces sp. NBC_00090]|uniref:LapA family protein n=1 Tax=Streptomyces sp. NBC_00090 TaxID=2903619 RepID=UPI00325279AE